METKLLKLSFLSTTCFWYILLLCRDCTLSAEFWVLSLFVVNFRLILWKEMGVLVQIHIEGVWSDKNVFFVHILWVVICIVRFAEILAVVRILRVQ